MNRTRNIIEHALGGLIWFFAASFILGYDGGLIVSIVWYWSREATDFENKHPGPARKEFWRSIPPLIWWDKDGRIDALSAWLPILAAYFLTN